MLWLREQGHRVLGVELRHLAAQAFFRESGHRPQCTIQHEFVHLEADSIRILCGDFFGLGNNNLAEIHAVYDRAAFIALPPKMRKHYIYHLLHILSPQILLITLDYPI